MKETLPTPKLLTASDVVQNNWDDLIHSTACKCDYCSQRAKKAAEFHIISAPIEQSRWITIDLLLEDIDQMQADQRAKVIRLSQVESLVKKKLLKEDDYKSYSSPALKEVLQPFRWADHKEKKKR